MNHPAVPENVKVCSVSELTRQVQVMLESGFTSVWVCGEIVNFSRPSSGHIYLTLKDARAQVRAVLWRSSAQRLRFEPHDGLEVIARGRLSVYAPRGDYQPGRMTGIALESADPRADHDELQAKGVDVDAELMGGDGTVPLLFFFRDHDANQLMLVQAQS